MPADLFACGVYTLSKELDYTREITLSIYNDTAVDFVLDHTYRDSGRDFNFPTRIRAGSCERVTVGKKFGSTGVKGTACYRNDKNPRDKMVFYFCNPVRGGNEIGWKYYWDSSNIRHWYYCDVPSEEANNVPHKKRINGDNLVCNYQMTGGNKCSGSYMITSSIW